MEKLRDLPRRPALPRRRRADQTWRAPLAAAERQARQMLLEWLLECLVRECLAANWAEGRRRDWPEQEFRH
jgi:hypothetical protein